MSRKIIFSHHIRAREENKVSDRKLIRSSPRAREIPPLAEKGEIRVRLQRGKNKDYNLNRVLQGRHGNQQTNV